MITVENLQLTILGLHKFFLSWDPVGDTETDHVLTIQRSDSPKSEWEDIGTVADTEESFLDELPNDHRKFIPHYYRVMHNDGSFSLRVNTPARPDKYVLNQNRLMQRSLQRDVGIKSYYFHKKKYGFRCDCWDPEARASVVPDCKECSGTGRKIGYADPEEIWIAYPPDTPNEMQANGVTYSMLTPQAWTANYPLIYPGDIIVREQDMEVFAVEGEVRRTGRLNYTSRQMFPLRAIEHGSIEYDLIERI